MSCTPWGQVAKWWSHLACGGPSLMKFWLQLDFFKKYIFKISGSSWEKWAIAWLSSQTCKRAIFQTFWRIHSCAKFLSFELETSNFGSSYVFLSPLKWRGRFLPNLTFWTQKWHISGKMHVLLFQNLESTLLCQIFVFWARDFKFWLQLCFFKPVKMAGSVFT